MTVVPVVFGREGRSSAPRGRATLSLWRTRPGWPRASAGDVSAVRRSWEPCGGTRDGRTGSDVREAGAVHPPGGPSGHAELVVLRILHDHPVGVQLLDVAPSG